MKKEKSEEVLIKKMFGNKVGSEICMTPDYINKDIFSINVCFCDKTIAQKLADWYNSRGYAFLESGEEGACTGNCKFSCCGRIYYVVKNYEDKYPAQFIDAGTLWYKYYVDGKDEIDAETLKIMDAIADIENLYDDENKARIEEETEIVANMFSQMIKNTIEGKPNGLRELI